MVGETSAEGAGAAARVRAWVRADFAVDLVTVEPVGHGEDPAAEVWRAVAADGARYGVKWTSGGSLAGLAVPAHLAAHGVSGVPVPVPTRSGRLWSERAGRRLALLPWVPGVDALPAGLSPARWRSFGALLARVHAAPVTGPLREVLPREEHTRHRHWLRTLWTVESGIASPGPADPPVRELAEEWRAAAGAVALVADQVEVLGRELAARPAERVLCHGDPHLGNVLRGSPGGSPGADPVGDDETRRPCSARDVAAPLGGREARADAEVAHRGDAGVWLVDWDDTVLAPREWDLMFVLGGVLAFAPVGPREQAEFFAGYGVVDVDPVRLAYYRCARAVEDLAELAARVLDHRRATADRAAALSLVRGVLSPTGLLARAVSSLAELGRAPADP
ncbi:spectinomycin phosphotransferase [Amycolatopsis arida]|uniref:Spectinomycin phosphotransferase n=1 Tax=Amycolatopsis arida TaxID=587909 RepID=A0A1I5XRU4_9PSEU|nr:phosphotransferase [Amycolatopsis arida]TDX97307.1 spectinomycin phosphotransferase [Amycolatopsis arida]SFQ34467.1 spectinomycin phosphotransferase [Amycolatopsis arida]